MYILYIDSYLNNLRSLENVPQSRVSSYSYSECGTMLSWLTSPFLYHFQDFFLILNQMHNPDYGIIMHWFTVCT